MIEYKTGDIISFKYKGGRKVTGYVLITEPKGVVLELHTDYVGKNETWFVGENKHFNTAEMKDVVVI